MVLADAVTKLETFVWILNDVLKSRTLHNLLKSIKLGQITLKLSIKLRNSKMPIQSLIFQQCYSNYEKVAPKSLF